MNPIKLYTTPENYTTSVICDYGLKKNHIKNILPPRLSIISWI